MNLDWTLIFHAYIAVAGYDIFKSLVVFLLTKLGRPTHSAAADR